MYDGYEIQFIGIPINNDIWKCSKSSSLKHFFSVGYYYFFTVYKYIVSINILYNIGT